MEIKQAIHGGDVHRVCREYGIPIEKIVDFSSNINPLPFPVGFKEFLMDKLDDIRRYPERDYWELRKALSSYTGYPPEWIMVGNGATELIYLVVRALSPKRVLLPIPCFGEYERAVKLAGGKIEEYPLRPEQNFQIDMQHLVFTMEKGYDMLFLCNPNNPTGIAVERNKVDKLLKKTNQMGTYVILDETFAEFVAEDGREIVQNIKKYRNGIVIGALTKFFAIPGMRLGYCIMCPDLLNEVAKWKEPWSVNCLASAAGTFLLNQKDFIEKTQEWIRKERNFFYNQLKELRGLKVYESQANFFLLELLDNSWTSGDVKRELEKKGLMVRDASSFKGLNNKFLRIAIKDRKSNLKLLQAFKELGL